MWRNPSLRFSAVKPEVLLDKPNQIQAQTLEDMAPFGLSLDKQRARFFSVVSVENKLLAPKPLPELALDVVAVQVWVV